MKYAFKPHNIEKIFIKSSNLSKKNIKCFTLKHTIFLDLLPVFAIYYFLM